ncbi:MAG TPA: type II toxin-antitoxin system PemK/MazF family toxin [Spirochaetia bacterium]
MLERYGVYWVNLDPVVGSEIAKTRPAVIISDDAMNRLLRKVVVCPVTSRLHPRWPSRVQARIGGQESEIAVDQIRTIDKVCVGAEIDRLDDETATKVRHIITVMYGVLSVN